MQENAGRSISFSFESVVYKRMKQICFTFGLNTTSIVQEVPADILPGGLKLIYEIT